jgi:hypothetical protein
VIDGTGAVARADQTLLIEDGKITAMGDAATTKIPDGTKTIDLADRTVVPGQLPDKARCPLNRGHGDLRLTGAGRQPMVSSNGELEVEHSGLEVSESK